MQDEKIVKKTEKACRNVVKKMEKNEELPSPLELKKMVESELDFGLSEEEIAVLAIAFKHIDNVYDMCRNKAFSENSLIYG